jgi:chromosome partitioning protein
MLTISLIAQKGGTGKTTVARCLAVAFERAGHPAAILDMDPQASATLWSRRREAEHPEVIPTVLPLLREALEAAENSVEVVFIDTPPKNADVAIEAAKVSDLIIIPCRPQIDDIETLPATKQILDVTGSKPTFVLLNGVPPNVARCEEAAAKISGHPTAPLTVCTQTIGHRAAFGDSSILGQTPQEYEPDSKAAEEIEKVHKYVYDIVRKLRSEKNVQTEHPGSRRSQATAR